jgi:macrolide-specific efflux system membrane fusion protein
MSRDRMKRIGDVAWKSVWIAGGLAATAVIAVLLRPARPAPRYETAPVTRADVENFVLATGVVQPMRQVDVGTRVTGQLKALRPVSATM